MMEPNFSSDIQIDNEFLNIAETLVRRIERANKKADLQRIHLDKLLVLMKTLEDYKPRSKIRQEKKYFLLYITSLLDKPIKEYTDKDLIELQSRYISKVTGNKLRKKGYTTKGAWLGGLIFILPVEITLWILIGEYYWYFPILSLPFVISQFRKELKAKKEYKLW